MWTKHVRLFEKLFNAEKRLKKEERKKLDWIKDKKQGKIKEKMIAKEKYLQVISNDQNVTRERII